MPFDAIDQIILCFKQIDTIDLLNILPYVIWHFFRLLLRASESWSSEASVPRILGAERQQIPIYYKVCHSIQFIEQFLCPFEWFRTAFVSKIASVPNMNFKADMIGRCCAKLDHSNFHQRYWQTFCFTSPLFATVHSWLTLESESFIQIMLLVLQYYCTICLYN